MFYATKLLLSSKNFQRAEEKYNWLEFSNRLGKQFPSKAHQGSPESSENPKLLLRYKEG